MTTSTRRTTLISSSPIKGNNASLAVAVLDITSNTVPITRIVRIREKPAQPKSTKASIRGFIFLTGNISAICVAAERTCGYVRLWEERYP